ncbi:hypothetical protein GS597_01690 [Synechococcales cyanobacterium C]|uniref:Uncharacterized protein n=1 Tax=Petrachloros mirabilis ULC683 TaxID=2781853 RepID=A0A8K1ZW77_9CYAN|nr:hypothetical protein [Petrachloros mirabilis]NCJ05248.1 hypothetical protein [Petrachloros mirabilis ULC683]
MSVDLAELNQEIARLQVALQVIEQERDRALVSAAQWRQRYEVEAQQRRRGVEKADQTIASLRAELQQLCQNRRGAALSLPGTANTSMSAQLATALAERDRLQEALEQEKSAHLRTRQNLINALHDALKNPSRDGLRYPQA